MILDDSKRQIHHTPGNVSVSSKHVLSSFDDGNRVIFPITPAVEGTGGPAVHGWWRGNTAPTEASIQQQASGTEKDDFGKIHSNLLQLNG